MDHWQPVVLGLGGTVDYEIEWDEQTLARLAQRQEVTASDLDAAAPIDTERDLLRALLAFVRAGVGGERFVADIGIIESFARHFPARITLGGTCVRAAYAMETVGIAATLHLVSIDDHTRRLLPANSNYMCSARGDSLYPHLIVQYPRGAHVMVDGRLIGGGGPNRVIFANDPPNRELVLDTRLGDALAQARVVLIAGFNVIQEAEVLAARLASLCQAMDRLPPDAQVFFEDAGYHRADLRLQVREALAGRVDVFSMNEDELREYVGREVNLLDGADVAAALGEVRSIVQAPVVVVHTRYWAAAVGGPDGAAGRYRDALASGIHMSSARYCYGDGYSPAQLAQVAQRGRHNGGAQVCGWLEAHLPGEVCAVAALDLDAVPQPTTIGLGDTFVGGFLAALVDPVGAARAWSSPAAPREAARIGGQ